MALGPKRQPPRKRHPNQKPHCDRPTSSSNSSSCRKNAKEKKEKHLHHFGKTGRHRLQCGKPKDEQRVRVTKGKITMCADPEKPKVEKSLQTKQLVVNYSWFIKGKKHTPAN